MTQPSPVASSSRQVVLSNTAATPVASSSRQVARSNNQQQRFKPYPAKTPVKGPAKTQRDKVSTLAVEEMPPSIGAWADALQQADQSVSPLTSDPADKQYVLPEPALFVNTTPERHRKFLHHWTLLSGGFMYNLSQPENTQLLSAQEWRDILGFMTQRGHPKSRTYKRSTGLEDRIRPALEASDVSGLDGFPVPLHSLPEFSIDQTREIVWQVAETSFRFKFCSLDRRASKKHRLDQVKACFVGHMLIGVPLQMSKRGLAAMAIEERHRYVAAGELYDRVKNDAFGAKAFQHTRQPQDREEEAQLPVLVTAWKEKQRSKKMNAEPRGDDGGASDDEEDEDGRGALLRGYTKAGWRLAIQKVISNKRTAEKTKRKTKTKDYDEEESIAETPAMSKLLGLTAYTGRDKFRKDCHDKIHEYSKTLPGTINVGGKFQKAEALLWAQEDHAAWEAAATADEDVDWVECQKLVVSGFKQMVDTLHASGKVEAVPEDIHVHQPFKKQYEPLVKDCVNGMYEWAEKPLKDYSATHADCAKGALPVFPLSVDALDEISLKVLGQMVTTFLIQSYEAAFGSQVIPWGAVADKPDEYYDAAQFKLKFAVTGLEDLTRPAWYDLANTLASFAGAGTLGFFRKASAAQALPPPARSRPSTPPANPSRPSTPPPNPSRPSTPPPNPSRLSTLPPNPSRPPTPPPNPSRPSTPSFHSLWRNLSRAQTQDVGGKLKMLVGT
ncbi:hypothetical protein FB451DRAFT_1186906 [Mycena latifolia]|nr:hypothetical protein FB451DRAFT_1186906 [Mycena latifolia]